MDFVNICRKALYFRGSLSICPAYAGMILEIFLERFSVHNLSRVCGDDPLGRYNYGLGGEFVPRMRG